ncbi:MAG: PsbP-related protein [Crocinitomix sp.]|nr:PsbP-related protein [Crocinitomix sp.]
MKIASKFTLFILTSIIVSCGGSDYNTFANSENGFQIDYPAQWDTTNLDPRMVFMAREQFLDSTDMFGEGFSISVFDNQGISLQSIVDENVKMTKLYFNSSEIAQEKFTTDNGIDCIQIEVNYEASGLNLCNTAVFVNHESLLYTITLSAEKSKKEEYKNTFDAIINSFNWMSE